MLCLTSLFNDNPRLTSTYLTSMSHLLPNAFTWEKVMFMSPAKHGGHMGIMVVAALSALSHFWFSIYFF